VFTARYGLGLCGPVCPLLPTFSTRSSGCVLGRQMEKRPVRVSIPYPEHGCARYQTTQCQFRRPTYEFSSPWKLAVLQGGWIHPVTRSCCLSICGWAVTTASCSVLCTAELHYANFHVCMYLTNNIFPKQSRFTTYGERGDYVPRIISLIVR
jgi:hypothetical protein